MLPTDSLNKAKPPYKARFVRAFFVRGFYEQAA
jgi:hypothetical protein